MYKLPTEVLTQILELVDELHPDLRTLAKPFKSSFDTLNTRIVIGRKKEEIGRKRSKDRLDAVLRVVRATPAVSAVHFMQMSEPRELDRILDEFSTRIDQVLRRPHRTPRRSPTCSSTWTIAPGPGQTC